MMPGCDRRQRCVAVMAGGRGLRLWPRSTAAAPKQFRRFFGMPVLLEQSLSHAALLAAGSCIYVVTTEDLVDATNRVVPGSVRLVAEPCGRDTALCVGLAALLVEHEYPGAVLTVLPADHWIGDSDAFERTLTRAADLAATDDRLVTVGVRPSRPETEYGYLIVDPALCGIHRGRRFREKPSAAEAAAFMAAGDSLWNAGIFAARASSFLALIREHIPAVGAGLDRIAASLGRPEEVAVVREVYESLQPVSFDHGVAELLTEFWVVPAEFPWDDLGSWSAFGRHLPRDAARNITAGSVHAVDSNDCLVDTPDLRVVLLGVSGLVVLQEGDSLLIADPQRLPDLKRIVVELGLDAGAESSNSRGLG